MQLSGRVKTLQYDSLSFTRELFTKLYSPAVHAGILARNSESDEKDLADQNIRKVDYVSAYLNRFLHISIVAFFADPASIKVVCNLYPFKETVGKINVTCVVPESSL